jgi:hypothetical protein
VKLIDKVAPLEKVVVLRGDVVQGVKNDSGGLLVEVE